jgi:hypothetical protein
MMVALGSVGVVTQQAMAEPAAPQQAAGQQTAGSGSAGANLNVALSTLSGMMPEIAGSTDQLRPQKWKLHGDERDSVERDVTSVRHDVDVTLPPLVQQAQSTPGSVEKALAVYRNVNALYDVLLRMTMTAVYSGGKDDATVLGNALDRLEKARAQLGQALLDAAGAQEATIARMQAAVVVQQQAATAAPKHIVVDDGPTKKTTAKKKPSAAKPPAGNAPPATGTGAAAKTQ